MIENTIALPIYCVRYSKIIIEEKLKFVFPIGNSLLIIASHMLPFNLKGETKTIIHFVLWVLFWNIVPLICRLISRKHKEKTTENEMQESGNSVKAFSSVKNKVCFSFVAFYVVFGFLYAFINFSGFSDLINAFVGLIPSVLILYYLLFEDKEFKFKSIIFPLAFGIIAFRNLYIVAVSVIGTPQNILFEEKVIILFVLNAVLALFNILCFCGTVFKFKAWVLLKIGCISYILTTVVLQIYELFLAGGAEYIQMSPVNTLALIKFFSIILFYIAIFIHSIGKKES